MGRAKASRKIRAQHKSERRWERFLADLKRAPPLPHLHALDIVLPGAPGIGPLNIVYVGGSLTIGP